MCIRERLVYFVDSAHIGELLTLLICLKLLLCSVTSYIYISRRFQPAPLFRILISVSYALMGYNILQCSNIMWLDGVIAAPVIALGIYRLISGNRRNLYFFTLFYGILTCWYTGYMPVSVSYTHLDVYKRQVLIRRQTTGD